MKTLQTIFFVAYFCLAMIILGGTIFAVMVEYPNWFADVPNSLRATTAFYRVLHPGYFFQTVAPLLLLSGIGFLVTGWKLTATRNLVLISFVLMLSAELLTFLYIYPRLSILFLDTGSQSVDALRKAAAEFTLADQIRTALGVLASGFAVAALFKFFKARYGGALS